jgi:hypothetical protein
MRVALQAVISGFGLIVSILSILPVSAGETTTCAVSDVSFDGTTPVRFNRVIGEGGSRLYLYQGSPPECQGHDCKSTNYLLPGDVVANGKSCGEWSFVQYIGKERVTVGWVWTARLAPLEMKLPFDAGTPPDRTNYFVPTTVKMRLLHGHGAPVCEAYLQRLNQTVFHEPPYCGRPENDQIPGFSLLNRVELSGQSYRQLYGHVTQFMGVRNSHSGEDATGIYDLSFHVILAHSGAWGYEPKTDIENNGSNLNLLVWGAQQTYPPCGARNEKSPQGARGDQIILVVNEHGDQLDDQKTEALFESPTQGLSKTEYARQGGKNAGTAFQPIGSSMSVFQYRGLYYFDTFYTGNGWTDFQGRRETDKSLNSHLAVFLREHGVTRQVCEYFYDDSTKANPFAVRQDP